MSFLSTNFRSILRNHCTESFRKAKARYITRQHTLLEKEADGTHRWRSLRELSTVKHKKDSIPDLDDNGTTASSNWQKADVLAKYFAKQCSSAGQNDDLVCAPFPLPHDHPILDFQPLSEHDVFKALSRLPVSKTTADKIITNRTLRECPSCISSSLTRLFNLSLSTNTFPKEWKQASVTPLYKNRGSPSKPSNYRPIFLLHAVGKVLDALVSRALLTYLTKEKLLSPHQFGFLPQRSTAQQLIYIINEWLAALDKGEQTYVVFMDFMKAFDRVWHRGLLYKLLQNGVSSDAVAWF